MGTFQVDKIVRTSTTVARTLRLGRKSPVRSCGGISYGRRWAVGLLVQQYPDDGPIDEIGAVFGAQLTADAFAIGFDGVGAQSEFARDAFCRITLADQFKDLSFTLSEPAKGGAGLAISEKGLGELATNECLAVSDALDSVLNLFWSGRTMEVSQRASSDDLSGIQEVIMGRAGQEASARIGAVQFFDQMQSHPTGEREVDKGHVGIRFGDTAHSLFGGGCFSAAEAEVVLSGQFEDGQPDQRVIGDDGQSGV